MGEFNISEAGVCHIPFLTEPHSTHPPLVWFLPTDSVNYFAFFILRELWEMPLTATAVPPRTLQQLLA